MKISRNIMFLLIILLAALNFGCNVEEDETLSVDEWIDKGLHYLSVGDGTSAYYSFNEALKIESGNLDARYGVVLSDFLQLEETVEIAAELLGVVSGETTPEMVVEFCSVLSDCEMLAELGMEYQDCVDTNGLALAEDIMQCTIDAGSCEQAMACLEVYIPSPVELCELGCEKFAECNYLEDIGVTEEECIENCPYQYTALDMACFLAGGQCDEARDKCFIRIGTTLQDLLEVFWTDISNEMLGNLDMLAENQDWEFFVPRCELSFLDLLKPGFSGVNGQKEVAFLEAPSNLLQGIMDIIFALDIDVNLTLVNSTLAEILTIELPDFSDYDQGKQELKEFLSTLGTLADRFVQDPVYSTFLALQEDGALQTYDASERIADALGSLITMIDLVEADKDVKDNEVIRYLDYNENGIWDIDEPLFIPGIGPIDKELVRGAKQAIYALKANFDDGELLYLSDFNGILNYYNLDLISLLFTALRAFDIGELNFAQYLRDPDPEGLRTALETFSYYMYILENAVDMLM